MSYVDLFNRYFPTPHYLEMPHAGIDISSASVRMAALSRTSGGLKIKDYAEEKLSSPILPGQALLSHKNLVEVLKKMQKEHNLKFVEVSIPEEKSYLFTLDVLDGTKEELRTRIEMHIEENVPISLDDAVFDYHRISKNQKTGMQFVAVSVVPLVVINEYVLLIESCGMIPISFLIENQALSRAIVKKGDRETYLIVNICHKNTVLSVVKDEAVQFTSTVALGSEDFTTAIATKLSIDKEEARVAKYEKGFSRDFGNESVSDVMMAVSAVLVEEIRKVFTYWNNINSLKGPKENIYYLKSDDKNNTSGDVKKILVAGKEAGIVGLTDFLAVSLKLPVEIANVWANIMSFENNTPVLSMKDSLSYGTALGLALLKDK